MRSSLPQILLALVAGILLMPLDASAQPSAKVYRIGVLETSPPDLRSPSQVAFYEELRQRGYVEGQNLVVERRNANRHPNCDGCRCRSGRSGARREPRPARR